ANQSLVEEADALEQARAKAAIRNRIGRPFGRTCSKPRIADTERMSDQRLNQSRLKMVSAPEGIHDAAGIVGAASLSGLQRLAQVIAGIVRVRIEAQQIFSARQRDAEVQCRRLCSIRVINA